MSDIVENALMLLGVLIEEGTTGSKELRAIEAATTAALWLPLG